MNQKDNMKENLIEEVLAYWKHYCYVCDLIAVKNHLSLILNDKSKINPAPNFTNIVFSGMIESINISLSRLYDCDMQAKTVQSLLAKCKNNAHLFADKTGVEKKFGDFINLLRTDENISYAIRLLGTRRDKLFAHNDKSLFVHPERDTTYLPNLSLWLLIDTLRDILQYVFDALAIQKPYEPCYDKDLENLLIK